MERYIKLAIILLTGMHLVPFFLTQTWLNCGRRMRGGKKGLMFAGTLLNVLGNSALLYAVFYRSFQTPAPWEKIHQMIRLNF